jgi:hypothetical protein
MNVSDDVVTRIQKELESIRNQAPPCPDPAEGGCIGSHCIWCATGEIQGMLSIAKRQYEEHEVQKREVDTLFAARK